MLICHALEFCCKHVASFASFILVIAFTQEIISYIDLLSLVPCDSIIVFFFKNYVFTITCKSLISNTKLYSNAFENSDICLEIR